jgi:LacI family transcriptional regulator
VASRRPPATDGRHPSAIRRRPTIQDLAREAGVSPSTASRAISGTGYAAAAVRQRVLDAAERIGYVPDANARSLRKRTSRSVGVLVSDLRNSFYADLAAGIEQELRAAGLLTIVVNDDGRVEDEVEGARTFIAMRVFGAIVTPVSAEAVATLLSAGVQVVQADRQFGDRWCDAVLVDNEAGAEQATRHLLGLGHRRIALLIDETVWTTGVGRLRGYRAALAAAGVPGDDELVAYTSFHAEAAQETARLLLERRPDVTAVFAANNVLAEGAFREVRRRGLRIPEDLSLVAFDDVPWMSMVSPAVTTVAQPALELGRTCARLLVDRLSGPVRPEPQTVRLQPSLLVRASTGRPAEG